MTVATARFAGRTHRLIASRWPTVGIFDRVADAADLEAVIALEGWTNDRLRAELGLLHRLPRQDWVTGIVGASLVMAAFCHPTPGGGRFSGPALGAWYCTPERETAFAETIHHHSRRLAAAGIVDARIQMRELLATIEAELDDLRSAERADLYAPDDYTAAQAHGEARRTAGAAGILYRSVRRSDGTCLAIFRPALVPPVDQGDHYDYVWSGAPTPTVIKLTNVAS